MRLETLALLPFLSTLSAASTLNVTVLGAKNKVSTLECWALEPGFDTSSEAGTSGSKSLNLGPLDGKNAGNSTYSVIPAHFDGRRHNAPTNQYVFLLFDLFILYKMFMYA